MTCQELRSHFEEMTCTTTRLPADSAEIVEHTATCAACSHFVEEQQELSANLRLVRESAPEIPASLDATALVNFHAFAAATMKPVSVAPKRSRIKLIAAFAWTTAIVAAMTIAGAELGLFFPAEEVATAPTRPGANSIRPAPKTSVPAGATTQRLNTSQSASAPVARIKRKPRAAPSLAESAAPALAQSNFSDSLPMRFRSLMYCDALSCAGPMEMIRVQLPPSAFGLASASSNDPVYADVLVGPDGIARGIRVVQ